MKVQTHFSAFHNLIELWYPVVFCNKDISLLLHDRIGFIDIDLWQVINYDLNLEIQTASNALRNINISLILS